MFKPKTFRTLVALLALSIAIAPLLAGKACASESTEIEDELTYCTEPRPQMCTMEYFPVCGYMEGGETKTFPNGCGACADATVVSHHVGICAQDLKPFLVGPEKQKQPMEMP